MGAWHLAPLLTRRAVVTSAMGMAVLTACTDEPAEDPASSSPSGAASEADGAPAPDPSAAFTTVTLPWGRAEVLVGVRPLVRTGEHLVLTLDLSVDGPHEDVTEDLITNFNYVWGADGGEWRGIRLLDLAGDVVATQAVDADRLTV